MLQGDGQWSVERVREEGKGRRGGRERREGGEGEREREREGGGGHTMKTACEKTPVIISKSESLTTDLQ